MRLVFYIDRGLTLPCVTRTTRTHSPPRVLNYESLPDAVKQCEYAVRGELYAAAQARVKAGKEVIFTNVGNPHGLGQKPVTFIRQVFALVRSGGLGVHGRGGTQKARIHAFRIQFVNH